MGSNGKNRAESAAPSILDYSEGQPSIASSWDRAYYVLFIFEMEDTIFKDTEMIYDSIRRLRNYIKHYPVDKALLKGEFVPVVEYLWKLIGIIYAIK